MNGIIFISLTGVCIDDERASNFCLKARNPCFCEENHHFMYNYCKDSCNWCDSSENVGEFMNTWSLRVKMKKYPTMKIIQCGVQTQTWAGWDPLGWSWQGFIVPQRNRLIFLQSDFIGSFDAPWSEWSWIMDTDLDHIPKERILNDF